ncbi:DNA translocase FtsK [bacterium]|nr:DNA translocase FtsK [bacterium]
MKSDIKKISEWLLVQAKKKRFFAFVLCFIACLLTLSFFSFYSKDPSWLYQSSELLAIKNYLGSFGANIAAFFFYVFGAASWIIIGALFYGAYFLFFDVKLKQEWDRLVAVCLLPVTVSSFLSWLRYPFFVGIVPGGVVGSAVHSFLFARFESVGSSVFLVCFLVAHCIVIFPKTFVMIVHAVVAAVQFVFNREKFLKPAYKISKKIVYIASVPFMYAYTFIKRLFSGADVLESNQSVVSFEQQLLDEIEQQEGIEQDDFWKEYVGGSVKKETENSEKFVTTSRTAELDSDKKIVKEKIKNFEKKEKQPTEKKYSLPGENLFNKEDSSDDDQKMMTELQKRAKILEEKLEKFGVYGSVVSIKRGPVVTLFEYKPKIDSKISKITSLEDDLALALQALSIRIIAPIPGKSVVGLEVANATRKNVLLSSLVHSSEFKKFKGKIPLVLGKDTVGRDVMVDLAKMPHLLIAGSTGSGKSVALNTFLMSMLCKLTPDQLKLILVDPKRLEFASYADIPHLLFPIVTNPKKTAPILRWVVNQMEERYEKMAQVGARNIFDYNDMVKENKKRSKMATKDDGLTPQVLEPLPFIVIVIDELSDLMMTCGRDIEDLIARVAQMARAAGIHMIVATQRPSVDVITGLIKVNFPSRISFRVTSKVDSRTILDYCGAEKLLGSGDMLFIDSGSSTLTRLHGAYVSNKEIDALANHIRAERAVEYLDISKELAESNSGNLGPDDALYEDVISFLNTVDEVSISLLQRKFRIGYNRSARIIDMLESRGVVMPSEGSKMRKVIR